MKRIIAIMGIATGLLASNPAHAGFLEIRLSYKVILDPMTGARPAAATDSAIDAAIAGMNQLLDTYSRGYRMRRVEPVQEVGGLGDSTGPSKWYSQDFLNNGGKQSMQDDAMADSEYAWDPTAIDIYINAGNPGGICSFPHDFWYDDHIIIIGAGSAASPTLTLHEIGHYFNLYHTQGRSCACCATCSSPESDHVNDTLEDRACWNQDDISLNNFDALYANLPSADQKRVDDTYFNIMSYRGSSCGDPVTRFQLTEDQLDRWADNAHRHRDEVVSGRTRFVEPGGNCPDPNGSPYCNSFAYGGPFSSVGRAVNEANPGDLIVFRPGSFNEHLVITKRVTLLATRQGPVTIGDTATDGIPREGPPRAPQGLELRRYTPESATLTWSDESVNEEGFEIQVGNPRGDQRASAWVTVGTVAPSPGVGRMEANVSLLGLGLTRTPCFKVVAFNTFGRSYSSQACGGTRFLRGDVNDDARVDLSDAIHILNFLFVGSQSRLACELSADANNDGQIDLGDPVRLLGFLFLGASPPALPFPECGVAATTGLSCEDPPCGGTSRPFKERLALRWAPVHLQDVDSTGGASAGGASDFITAVDYDGNWSTTDNWENVGRYPARATCYYSVVTTRTHWFILYAFYHPRDWHDGGLDDLFSSQHENDMEGFLAIVRRPDVGGDEFGELLGIVTVAHTDFYSYVPDASDLRAGGESVDGKLSLVYFDGKLHPLTAQEAAGHGLKAWPDYSIHGDGIRYVPRNRAEVPSPPRDGHVQEVSYELVDIFAPGGLWARRRETETFASWGVFRGDTESPDAANAPWGWDDTDDDVAHGALATDPAALVRTYFTNLGSFSSNYLDNAYDEDGGE